MGLFDKLFGKKSRANGGYGGKYNGQEYAGNYDGGYDQLQNRGYGQNAAEQQPDCDGGQMQYGAQATEAPGQQTDVQTAPGLDSFDNVQDVTPRDEYLSRFRSEFRHHFPKSLDTVESHMQLPYMIGAAVDISPVIEYAAGNVYARFEAEPDKLPELSRAAVAKVAMQLESYIASQNPDFFLAPLARAHSESLEKAWIVLDFYCRMLKADYTRSITMLYNMVTDEIIKRMSVPAVKAQSESYEEVLARCASLISADRESTEIPALQKRLFEKLMKLDSIYVIHDETFNSAFPYIGADGRLEIQTNAERAASLKEFLEKNGDSRVSIKEYRKEEYEKLFSGLLHNGLTVIRLDNGLTPVEIDIDGLYDNGERNLIEVCNRYARRMFISELQYGYRLKNLLDDKRDSEDYRILSSSMIKARTEGYRALAGGLVYVFNIGGARPGTTLYTREAIENASEIMKVMGIVDESTLVAQGDNGFAVFGGEIALRSVQRKSTSSGKGYICAFTDRENAERIHQRFGEAGATDAIVVMTLGELCRSCKDSAGFILDMSSYGLEIPVEVFGKMSECIKTEGLVVGGKSVGKNDIG